MKRLNPWLPAYLVLLLLMVPGLRLLADEWIVPPDKKAEVAPFKFTEETREKGAAIFTKNCQQCHGEPTKANWANIQPAPGDPASERFRKLTDGELFYKITNGKSPMPQFMNILSEEERWDVISYIRSFHPGYVQPNPEQAVAAAHGGHSTLVMSPDTVPYTLRFAVTNTKGDVVTPAANAGIKVFVKRYFGMFQAGTVKTDNNGLALFTFQDTIPGDEMGRLIVEARLDENSGYGYAEASDTVPFGKPTHWVSLTDARAMWNIRAKAPVWLVLAYTLSVMGVFSTLFYIFFRIRKIYILGRSDESASQ
jgi:mono/diheme cytochrome c family protein